MGTRHALTLAICTGLVLAGGCGPGETGTMVEPIPAPPQYDRPLPPGAPALAKVTDLGEIPDFTDACRDVEGLKEAIDRSLNYLSKPSSWQFFPCGDISHERVVASLEAFSQLLDRGMTPEEMNADLRRRFDVYMSVGWDGSGAVWFTGYYTPIFEASRAPTSRFRWPLYREPANLVKDHEGAILGLRTPDGAIVPCPSRRDLERSGQLAGGELAYLADAFEAYIAHVQGSARLRMTDGGMMTVGYAASNGRDYVSVAKELVADGKIAADRLSLQAMIDYFRAHPRDVTKYTWRNPRYIFFAVTEGDAPRGCLNEPVTPMRTIATDKSIFPRAALAFVSATLPRRVDNEIEPLLYGGFALDQDAGGAIRAAGRCDIYIGTGEEAGELAGRIQQEGRLYYLLLKEPSPPAGE